MSRRDSIMISALISNVRAKINKVKQIRDDDRYYDAEFKRLTENVRFFEAQLDELVTARAHADEMIHSLYDERERLIAELQQIEHSTELTKLQALQSQLAALEASQTVGAS